MGMWLLISWGANFGISKVKIQETYDWSHIVVYYLLCYLHPTDAHRVLYLMGIMRSQRRLVTAYVTILIIDFVM